MKNPAWMFKKYAPDDTQRDSVSGEFFKNTRLESVIREAIQNSLDARPKGYYGAIKVRIYYSGSDAAIDGNAYAAHFRGEEIDAHYSHKSSGLVRVPMVDEKCVFLTIEDFNTTGLTGSVSRLPTEDELESDRVKGNYYNYFFRENRSNKDGAGALGSWGAGKIMFMKASCLRTAFTLSVRDDNEAPRFLAGRSVLMSHCIGSDMYTPDCWFGVDAGEGDNPSGFLRRQPVTDEEQLDSFSRTFHLSRTTQKGTSIVIPYLNVENENGEGAFNLENIVQAVIKNFLVAILNGTLQVEIETGNNGDTVELNQQTLPQCRKYLPENPDSKGYLTRRHYDLAARVKSGHFPEDQVVALKLISPNLRPCWSDGMFSGHDLKVIKKSLSAGKTFLFEVPISVQIRGASGKEKTEKDIFEVYIHRIGDSTAYRTAFYRIGLLIDAASTRSYAGYVTIVNVKDGGELAKLLVASEPPSHNEWDAGAERVKKGYTSPSAHINYVKSSVLEIISRIEAADQDPDWNPLIGSFGIPLPERDDEDKKPKAKQNDDKDNEKPVPDERKMSDEIPEELVHLEKFKSKIGFTLSMGADRVAEKGYPFVAPYRMGYSPFTRSSWSRFDFDLSKHDKIKIEYEKPEQKDIVEIQTAEENRLELKVKKPGAFRVYVTGFDENRDLEVTKMHYKYNGQVEREK